ncbi:hypothetical protein LTR66_016218, partial [Elasticomyces elasticus]
RSESPLRIDELSSSPAKHDASIIEGPYLPIYAPLLPASNILRARIKPQAYPTIYSKVVIQGLSPNVPVPLNHMIGALVAGWKAEGNWLPQVAAAEATQTQMKSGKKTKTETAFAKWKREQEERKRRVLRDTPGAMEWQPEMQYIQEEEPEKKGVKRVLKKVIGMHHSDKSEKELEKIGLTFEVDDEAMGQNQSGQGVVP